MSEILQKAEVNLQKAEVKVSVVLDIQETEVKIHKSLRFGSLKIPSKAEVKKSPTVILD